MQLLIGAAGPALARARAIQGEPLSRLSHPQLQSRETQPGDRVFVGAFSPSRQLELIGAVRIASRDGADATAAPPLTLCEAGCIVPHKLARSLRDQRGRGLRFARSELYELHPVALLKPLDLDEASADALARLLTEAETAPAPDGAEASATLKDIRVIDLGLSTRSTNALLNYGVATLAQLRAMNADALGRVPNLGATSVAEILARLVGQFAPVPEPSQITGTVGLSLRTSNALRRAGILDSAALRATPRADLEALPNFGAKAMAEVEAYLATTAPETGAIQESSRASAAGLAELRLSLGVAEALANAGYDDVSALVHADRKQLAAISGIGASGAAEVAEATARLGTLLASGRTGATPLDALSLPSEFREALRAAGEANAESLAERSAGELRALAAIGPAGVKVVVLALERAGLTSKASAGGSDDRNTAIARERLGGATLQEIADRHGITRERVRQIVRQFGLSGADAAGARRAVEERKADAASPELRRRYREGQDAPTMARELGLQRSAIDNVLARVLTQTDRAARVAASAKASIGHGRADAELLEALRALTKRLGKSPTASDYLKYSREVGLPGPQTVMSRFDGWNAALEAAGLEPRVRRRAYKRQWDEQRCRTAAEALARELGRWPTHAEYETLAAQRPGILPSSATLRNRLGAWSAITLAMARMLEADASDTPGG